MDLYHLGDLHFGTALHALSSDPNNLVARFQRAVPGHGRVVKHLRAGIFLLLSYHLIGLESLDVE